MNVFLEHIVTEVKEKGVAYEKAENIREWLKMEGLELANWAAESGLDYEFWDLPNPRPSKEKFTPMVKFSSTH